MAKTNGLALTTLSVDTSGGTVKDIRNDVKSFSISTPRGVQDVTGVDKSAIERLLLLADFSITLNGTAFNDNATNGAHFVLKTIPSSSVQRTVSIGITGTVGANTLNNECIFTDYSIDRGDDGGLSWTAPGVLADGTVPTWS
jgi:hypothetical protein